MSLHLGVTTGTVEIARRGEATRLRIDEVEAAGPVTTPRRNEPARMDDPGTVDGWRVQVRLDAGAGVVWPGMKPMLCVSE